VNEVGRGLEAFNGAIIGPIDVIATFRGDPSQG
jgi:hypothetical protein